MAVSCRQNVSNILFNLNANKTLNDYEGKTKKKVEKSNIFLRQKIINGRLSNNQ